MHFVRRVWSGLRAVGELNLKQFMTSLGVAVGVVVIIAAVGLGSGEYLYIKRQFREVIPTSIHIQTNSQRYSLTVKVVDEIIKKAPSVNAATLLLTGRGQVSFERAAFAGNIVGVNNNYETVFDVIMEAGTFISSVDNEHRLRVAVIGWDAVDALYGGQIERALASSIVVNGHPLQVVGVYQRINDDPENHYGDDRVFVPYEVGRQVVLPGVASFVAANAKDIQSVPDALYELRLIIRELYPHAGGIEIGVMHVGADLVLAKESALIKVLVLGLTALMMFAVSAKSVADAAVVASGVGASTAAKSVVMAVIGGITGAILGLGLSPLFDTLGSHYEKTLYAVLAALLMALATGIAGGWYATKAQVKGIQTECSVEVK